MLPGDKKNWRQISEIVSLRSMNRVDGTLRLIDPSNADNKFVTFNLRFWLNFIATKQSQILAQRD